MNSFERYCEEIKKLLDKDNLLYFSEIKESLSEIENINLLSYDKIILAYGAPLDFIKDFIADRKVEPVYKENMNLLQAVRIMNILLYVVILYFILIQPFAEVRYGSNVYFSKTVLQLASEGSPQSFLLGFSSLVVMIISLEYYQRQILFSKINNLMNYLKKLLKLVLILITIDIILQSSFINEAYDIYNNKYNLGSSQYIMCNDIYNDCDILYSGMWNFMQWMVTWMISGQIILLLIAVFYRLNRNGISIRTFEEMEKIEFDTKAYPSIIIKIYKINALLIVLLMPIFYSLSNFGLSRDLAYYSIVIVDVIITFLIFIQLLLFSGLSSSLTLIGDSMRNKEYSNSKNKLFHFIYGMYFILTTIAEYSGNPYNSDGFVVTTSLLAIAFLNIMWAIEIPERKKEILLFIPIPLIFMLIIEFVF